MIFNQLHRKFMLPALACLLAGCAATPAITYNPYYVPAKSLQENDEIAGKVFVYTTLSDDQKSLTTGATTFAGRGGLLVTPIGKITRELALRVFKRVGTASADAGNSLPSDRQYAVIIRPETTKFTYGFGMFKNLGAPTPQVDVALKVTVVDSTGCSRREFTYMSGLISGPGNVFGFGDPVQDVSRLLHETLYNLFLKAARDLKDYTRTTKAAAEAPCVSPPVT